MFKIFVLCTLLVTIGGVPTHHQGVDTVPESDAVENEPLQLRQSFPVPDEQVLKAIESQSKDVEVVDPTPLKATVADVSVDTAVEIQEVNGKDDRDKNRTLILLLAKKTTTAAPVASTTPDAAAIAALAAAAAAGKR